MKELLKKLTEAEMAANKADREYNIEPENVEKEAAFDQAYNAEYKAYMEAAEELVKITGGKIEFDIAKRMIQTKRAEIEALFT